MAIPEPVPTKTVVFRLPAAMAPAVADGTWTPGPLHQFVPPGLLPAEFQNLYVTPVLTVDDWLVIRMMALASGTDCSKCKLVDPRTYKKVDVAAHRVSAFIAMMQNVTIVTYQLFGYGFSPTASVGTPPVTSCDQGYRKAPVALAQAVADATTRRQLEWGVNADGVASLARGRGEGVGLHVIDRGWDLKKTNYVSATWGAVDHPAILRPCFLRWGRSGTTSDELNHGMSTLGVLAAGGPPDAMRGICRGAWRIDLYGAYNTNGVLDPYNAFMAALARSAPGDVILIEDQIKPGSSYLPVEFEDHFFQAIRLARALCVLVVEPAGNGDLDLDAALAAAPRAPAPGDPCDIMDSGALMVGAAAPDTHCRYASSSYGDVVRGFAWGSNVVTSTAGQGYTELYSDTSSAAAIVAGAAVVAQALALQATGAPMRPDTLRFELNDTGTDSASSADQIGRMPNLRAFADKLGLP